MHDRLTWPLAIGAVAVWSLSGCSHALQRNSAGLVRPAPAMERQIRNAVDAGEGDYEAKILRAKVDAHPLDVAPRLELAGHYEQKGFRDIAIEHCRLACERAPESKEAHLALARLLHLNGSDEEALSGLEAFAAGRQADVDVFTWLGVLRDAGGDLTGAEDAHRNALVLAPVRDDLHNNLGFSLLRLGRGSEAVAEFRAALKINSRSVVARNNLGEALAAGDQHDAVLNWQSATDPASAHNNLAAALIEAGKFDEARREIGIALGYDARNGAALRNLSLISELDGKAAEAAPERNRNRLARAWTAWVRYWTGTRQEEQAGATLAAAKTKGIVPKL